MDGSWKEPGNRCQAFCWQITCGSWCQRQDTGWLSTLKGWLRVPLLCPTQTTLPRIFYHKRVSPLQILLNLANGMASTIQINAPSTPTHHFHFTHNSCVRGLNMPTFQSKPFRSSRGQANDLGERIGRAYRNRLDQNPFLFFGLPFISLILAASFLLTPATALRYEKHDRKNRTLTHAEAMELGLKGGAEGEGALQYNPRRRVVAMGGTSERDEYYKLMAKDLDDWEQKRVERWKGEPDGRL